ncbi:peptidoglycan DD-metalloendopeptidase family protein [Lyngbya aestuarii]|uniref:peptidoglycan DD-metalloendopeptidase family protein n=1 Tax=Lyngbya aestuarii TaxID=118322 RepID=UPI00403DC8F4
MSAIKPKRRKNYCLLFPSLTKAWFGGVVFGILVWLLALITPVHADPSLDPASVDTLRQMQEQIEQQRSNIIKKRDRLSDIEKAAQGQLRGILYNLESTDTNYQDYDAQIQATNKRIKELQVDLTEAERVYYQKQAATIARLRFLQRQQRSGFGWDTLLESQNLSEFLRLRRRVKLVYQADLKMLNSLKAEADRIKEQKAEIERQKNKIALITQQILAKKENFEKQLAAQQQLIERLNTDQQALEAAQAQLAADSRGFGILIRRTAAKARYPYRGFSGSGQLLFPSEAEITSEFGWRRHPILGKSRFHSGIDFGASYGSTIRAAESGKVIFSGWYGGYGYAVVIDHGGGLATLYGHTSKLYVSEGQSVKLGEVIAAVGSTGLSTGPHLHFEVRKQGEPIDPMIYL